ncbi:MAG TPA: efflux transporter outer membrane subunit [Woeseiaceae bacterium]|nr:efflux transporter outer membrane subunit [Woeseiaceae bacterium]
MMNGSPKEARIARLCKRMPGLLLATAFGLSACSLAPRYEMPEQPVPAQWEGAETAADAEPPAPEWWRRYGSAELDALMERALEGNHDLAAAVARIEQARAGFRVARSALWPFLGASAGVSRDRTRNGETVTSEDSRAGVSADYTVDLWGANRNAADIAALRLAVTEHDRDAILLALQTDVAAGYFQLLALADRTRIAERNLEAARELLRLIEVRFDNGAATALDLAQQRTVLLNIEAQLPVLRQATVETRRALAVLAGLPPGSLELRGGTIADLALPAIDPGIPAEALLRRPDIRAAEAALIAANADIGIARAALFPDLGVSASAFVRDVAGSGSVTAASIAASLAQTLFDGGARRGRIELSQAARQELAENYAQAVLVALTDVENALTAVATSQRRVEILTETVAQAREAYRLSRVRFDAGAIDLLTVLDSQRTLLSAEDSLVQAKQARLDASAVLVRALGGGTS